MDWFHVALAALLAFHTVGWVLLVIRLERILGDISFMVSRARR